MTDEIQQLRDVQGGKWLKIAEAMRAGLPVPNGFVATGQTAERSIRSAYDDLKVREHTHYVAVRAPSHAILEVIGPDRLVHTLRRLWMEFPDAELLIQAMVNSAWCGKAAWEGKNLRIRASEGLMCLDPDTYLFNLSTHKCTRRTLHQRPRKVFRGVDGSTKTMDLVTEHKPMESKYVEAVAELAKGAAADITWALDDRRAWLIGLQEV